MTSTGNFPSALVVATLLAACGDSCFVRGSRVLTPRGWRPIESLTIGDEVVSFDTALASVTVRRVREVLCRAVPRVIRLRAGEIAISGVSPEHPFWDAAAGAFRPAVSLSLESRVLVLLPGARSPRELAVEEVAVVASRGPVEVWNLEVEGEHTYFVEGVLVHNKSTCEDPCEAVGGGAPGGGSSTAQASTAAGPTGPASTSSAGGTMGHGGGGDGGGISQGSTGQGGTGQGGGAGGGGTGGGGTGGGTIGGDRPVEVFVPSGYDPDAPAPLVIFLHGYSDAAEVPEFYVDYLQIEALAEELGFLFAMPEGTVDEQGAGFWNATPACCDFFASGVDDSGYLRSVVEDIGRAWSVDPRRVHFIGHSNGGFMSYRLACDHADAIASIVSLAGATFADESDCAPSEPVSILQIHGTLDDAVFYDGGEQNGALYPGAVDDARIWAAYGGCDQEPTAGPQRDLSSFVDGDETAVSIWADGCDPAGGSELWSIEGEGHVPTLSETFSRQAITWLLDHPKP